MKGFRRTWQRVCRDAGCPGMLPHDLRRTAARNMVSLGIPERVVMAVMGHKTAAMLYRYCIVSPGDLQAVARKFSGESRTDGHNFRHSSPWEAPVSD